MVYTAIFQQANVRPTIFAIMKIITKYFFLGRASLSRTAMVTITNYRVRLYLCWHRLLNLRVRSAKCNLLADTVSEALEKLTFLRVDLACELPILYFGLQPHVTFLRAFFCSSRLLVLEDSHFVLI